MPMPEINAIFYWFGGVLVEGLPQLVGRGLFDLPIEKINIHTRLRLREQINELALGRLNAQAFCAALTQEYSPAHSASELESWIKQTVNLRADVLNEIAAPSDAMERWIICDYPRDWYESAVSGHELPIKNTFFTAESNLSNLVPDIFYELSRRANYPLNRCLMVDAVTPRTVEAVKHNLHASIFVDARRLQREFALRRMIPPPPGFVHPGPPDT